MQEISMDRRKFLAQAGLSVAGAGMLGLLGGCANKPSENLGNTGPVSGEIGDDDWLGEAPAISEKDCVRTEETEILVIGAATAGSFAAYSAIRNGSKVTLIDKNFTYHYGGSGMSFVGSKFQKEQGCIQYDKTELLYDLIRGTQCRADPSMLSLWINRSGEILDNIIEDICKPYSMEYGISPHAASEAKDLSAFKDTQVTLANPAADIMKPVLVVMHQYLTDNDCDIRFSHKAEKLVQDENGAVIGAIVTNDVGETVFFKASKGVIVCTGSYGADEKMVKTFISPKLLPMFQPAWYTGKLDPEDQPKEDIDTGDGHKMMCWAGATMEDTTHSYNGWVMSGMMSCPYLNVTQSSGRRFQNEAMSFLNQLQMIVEEPNPDGIYYWQIITEEPDAEMKPLLEVPLDSMKPLLDSTLTVESDTLEGLAEKMGVDKDGFVATVKRYNELCEKGYDEDYGKLPEYMIPVKTPPFKAARTDLVVACTLSGVICNNKMEVLDKNGFAIPGLYAAGNTVGRRFGWAYEGSHIGLTNAMAITHAYVAGENASKR